MIDNAQRGRHVPTSAFVVGVAGRLAAEKGISVLLESMKEVLAKVPRAWLVIAGDGPERAALECRAHDLRIDHRVDFLGMRADLPRIMAALDVFVLPSLYEGFGLVVLEAMAVGVPVIATCVGGVPEVVEDGVTGVLVPPGDPSKLAEAILRLERDGELAKMLVEHASTRLRSEFDMARMLDAIERLYFSLLS
jgi:glycosyltransferase involved in cell wall biosynthesis